MEDKKVAEINEVLCKGCGTCVAACPSGSIHQNLFEDEEIYREIELLERTERTERRFEETYDLGFAHVGQEEEEEESKGGFPWLIVIILLLAAGGGAYYYFMM